MDIEMSESGDEGVRREAPANYVTCDHALVLSKRIDTEQRSAEFIASTASLDSHGDVVEQDWRLDHYLANPIVLYGHMSRELPIGQATRVAVEQGRLVATIKFASAEANPQAEQVWRLVQERVLRAVSVGFQPTDGRYEVRDGREVFVWRGPLLKEISVVPVPANHEALARMKSLYAAAHAGAPETVNHSAPSRATETEQPSGGVKENMMDPKELLAKIDALATEKAAAETTLKTLTTERDAATKAAAEYKAAVETLTAEKAALDAQCTALAAERDGLAAKAVEMEAQMIDHEVGALVGEKISADEKPLFIELRKSNPDLFTKMVAQRGPMRLTERVVPPAPNGANVIGDLAAALRDA